MQPISIGGVKLLDPERMAKAMLVKLLIRGLSPDPEPWKNFIVQRILQLRMRSGRLWPQSAEWFDDNSKGG